MVVEFDVYNQKMIPLNEKPYIVNKSRNYLQLKFNFKTEDWENLNKFILFRVKDKHYLEELGKGNEVIITVPNYTIKNNFLIFTVYGQSYQDDFRITTKERVVILKKSGYTKHIDKYDGETIDYDVISILIEKIGKAFTDIEINEKNIIFKNFNGEVLKIIPMNFLENYYDKNEIDEKFSRTIVNVDTSELAETGCLIFDKFYEE